MHQKSSNMGQPISRRTFATFAAVGVGACSSYGLSRSTERDLEQLITDLRHPDRETHTIAAINALSDVADRLETILLRKSD
jgi:hypothetical protein